MGMANDGGVQPVGRRRLLRGLAGASTVGIATALGTRPAAAADGDSLTLGAANAASSATRLTTTFGQDADAAFAVEVDTDGLSTSSGATWPAAILAQSARTVPVMAVTDDALAAVYAEAKDAAGLFAHNQSVGLPTVSATSRGRAPALGGASSQGAQLLLHPEPGRVGPPAGYFPTGSVLLDSVGDLYVKTTEESTGWLRLVREDQVPAGGRTVALAEPARVLDEPVRAGSSKTVVVAPATGIPADATAVLGSISAFRAGFQGRVLVAPVGATNRAVALGFTRGMPAAAGVTTGVRRRPKGAAFTIQTSGSGSETVHVRVDLTAYVTG
jgi:hypothetical protein